MESKTIRVKRLETMARTTPEGSYWYWTADGRIACFLCTGNPGERDLDIVITPVASPEERLREARVQALDSAGWNDNTPVLGWSSLREIVAIIERVDAEFAKATPRE